MKTSQKRHKKESTRVLQASQEKKSTRFKSGDYVLATTCPRGESRDPWCIGFLCSYDDFTRTYIVSFGEGLQRRFGKIAKITPEEGRCFLRNMKILETATFRLWTLLRDLRKSGKNALLRTLED
ncbi:MAG: hypothetical protein HGA67_00545 [Candidatus Yonathbacteria bacterium]|nr:hypothetical protein [Candidatus Yonathbacteria bacterium]